MHKSTVIRLAAFIACGFSATAGANAQLSLSEASATLAQTGETEWTLSKTGALNAANSTVTWQVLATQEDTVPGRLRINGHVRLTNTGSTAATLGNVVVNLQTRSGKRWLTLASDVADATNGDAAVTASIATKASSEGSSSFTESAASGSLSFEHATTNAVFPLVPQQVIAPAASVPLLYTAEFDNTVLALPVGAQVRAELIVSYGNAPSNPSSTSSIDINGNGVIDADEARVRSAPARSTLSVPAQSTSDTPTLSDTLDDISTTGTVTFENAQFSLGATSGTVTALVDGGTDGGTITNCAHLTSAAGTAGAINLESCRAVTVPATSTCMPGAPGCGWDAGDMVTASQSAWGDSGTSVGALLTANFNSIYPMDLVVGAGNTLTFTDAPSVFTYLPASGTASALTSSTQNPLSTSSGNLGGEVVALRLNIDFSSLVGNTVTLGDLYICNFSDVPSLNGQTVSQFLGAANQILGGNSLTYSATVTAAVARLINNAFVDGVPSTFAQDSLVNGDCPSTWKANDMVTYDQSSWGSSLTTAGSLLNAGFAGLYGTSFVVGGNLTMTFSNADALFAYLPDANSAGVLTSNLFNPTTSAAGQFGGEVVALQLNVDFSEATLLSGIATLGSLRFCNTPLAALNGQTIDQFLTTMNGQLGGGASPFTVSTATSLTRSINTAFAGGTPSTFAQDYLVNGDCP